MIAEQTLPAYTVMSIQKIAARHGFTTVNCGSYVIIRIPYAFSDDCAEHTARSIKECYEILGY